MNGKIKNCVLLMSCLIVSIFKSLAFSELPSEVPFDSPSELPSQLPSEQPADFIQEEEAPLYAPFQIGAPISGVPVNDGLWILVGFGVIYGYIIKRRMKKNLAVGILVLLGCVENVSAQNFQEPAGAKRIFLEDFGGNGTEDDGFPRVATKVIAQGILPDNNAVPVISYGWTKYNANSATMQNGEWCLAKFMTSALTVPAWWANTNGQYRTFQDHTSPDGTFKGDNSLSNETTIKGYMLVLNAADDTNERFFQYTLTNLCPKVRLYFSVYAGNLVRNVSDYNQQGTTHWRDDPNLKFVLLDNAGDTLSTYVTGAIPKTNPASWLRYGFGFTNTDMSEVTLKIYSNQKSTNGNDLVLDDIEIYEVIPTISVPNLKGPQYYCPSMPMNLTAIYEDAYKTFTNPKIQWLYSADPDANLSGWVHAGDGTNDVGPTCTAPAKVGYYRAVVGDAENIDNPYSWTCCVISDSIEVRAIEGDVTLYWKLNPVDQNWNNPDNWQLSDGSAVTYAASQCTDVHIPGNASLYPSLDTTISGPSSACKDIWFHFGGEVAKPQLLTYHYAYVQYNFGVSRADGTTANEDFLPWNATQVCSATPLERGRWYALAAPLKKIASGDFCVGGYPNFWQQSYKTSPNQTSGNLEGEWYRPVNTNSWDIGNQYNAIAIWAGAVTGTNLSLYGEGPNYQKNLDQLHGIIEVPYFENQTKSDLHRLHRYENGISYFGYYNYEKPDLPETDNTPGQIARGAEAYRFIFDGSLENTTGDYIMNIPFAEDIMVGNPFMSTLNFDSLYLNNEGFIGDSYRIYKEDNTSYDMHTYSSVAGSADIGPYIAPLQAFFIETEDITPIRFPKKSSVTRSAGSALQLRSSSGNSFNYMKDDVLYLQAKNGEGSSCLTISMQNTPGKNLNFVYSRYYPGVPQLYAVDASGQKNSLQFEGGYTKQVSFGLVMDNPATFELKALNVDKLKVNALVLKDNYTGKEINLLDGSESYSFENIPGRTGNRFTLQLGDYIPTGLNEGEVAPPITAWLNYQTLYVQSDEIINQVELTNMQGVLVFSEPAGKYSFEKNTDSLPPGMYILTVKLANGKNRQLKLMV